MGIANVCPPIIPARFDTLFGQSCSETPPTSPWRCQSRLGRQAEAPVASRVHRKARRPCLGFAVASFRGCPLRCRPQKQLAWRLETVPQTAQTWTLRESGKKWHTPDSRMVPHFSTDEALNDLTLQIERDAVVLA
jgi:hypothetical protein